MPETQWIEAALAARKALAAFMELPGAQAAALAPHLRTIAGREVIRQTLGASECEVLRWAFAAELAQAAYPASAAAALVDCGITLQELLNQPADALAARIWELARTEADFGAAQARVAAIVPAFEPPESAGDAAAPLRQYREAELLRRVSAALTEQRQRAEALGPMPTRVEFYDILAVSDFHLAAGNRPSPEGLTRFSPTEDFYFDDAFFRFLVDAEMERRGRNGRPYELVFNGDMMDFAQIITPEDATPRLTAAMLPLLAWPESDDGSLTAQLQRTVAAIYGKDTLSAAIAQQSDMRRAALQQAGAAALAALRPAAQAKGLGAPFMSAAEPDARQDWEAELAAWSDTGWETWTEEEWAQRLGHATSAAASGAAPDAAVRLMGMPPTRPPAPPIPNPRVQAAGLAAATQAETAKQAQAERGKASKKVCAMERKQALAQLADVYFGHPHFFAGLAWFLAQGNRLVFIRGNHDPQWYWPEVQGACVGWLKQAYDTLRAAWNTSPRPGALPISPEQHQALLTACGALPDVPLAAFAARVDFAQSWYYYREELAYFEHGGQQEAVDAHRYFLAPVYATAASGQHATPAPPEELEIDPPVGSLGNVFFINLLESNFPNFERPGYDKVYLPWLLYHAPGLLFKTLPLAAGKMLRAWSRWAAHHPQPAVAQRHAAQLKRYAAQSGLPEPCARELDETTWVKRWRGRGQSALAFFIRIVLPYLLPLLAALTVLAVLLISGARAPTPPTLAYSLLWSPLLSLLVGLAMYWLKHWMTEWFGLGEDYMLKPAQRVAAILERHGCDVPYILFGHDHAHNAQSLGKGRWYLNTGTWTYNYARERKQLFRAEHEYSFVRMIDAQHVLAAQGRPPEQTGATARPQVEILRWNDNAGRTEPCVLFES